MADKSVDCIDGRRSFVVTLKGGELSCNCARFPRDHNCRHIEIATSSHG